MRNHLRGWWCRRSGHDWFPNIISKVIPITNVCLRCKRRKTDPPTDHPGWERLWKEIDQ